MTGDYWLAAPKFTAVSRILVDADFRSFIFTRTFAMSKIRAGFGYNCLVKDPFHELVVNRRALWLQCRCSRSVLLIEPMSANFLGPIVIDQLTGTAVQGECLVPKPEAGVEHPQRDMST